MANELDMQITENEKALRQAILSFLHGEYSGPAIMRKLVRHSCWRVRTEMKATGPVPRLEVDDSGQKWLQAYSDRGILAEVMKDDPLVLEISGTALFRMTNPMIAGVELNPGHETAIHFSEKQFKSLEMWSKSIEIERLLESPDSLATHRKIIISFERFLVLAERTHRGMHLLLTGPDDIRQVAVFTADDSAQRFKNQINENEQRKLELRAYDGFSLFHELENLAVDGLVFNPSGPTPKVMKDATFISTMIGVPGMLEDSVLNARSVAEAHLYMDMLGCPPGRRNHRLVDIGGHLVSQYSCPTDYSSEEQTFRFLVASNDLDLEGFGTEKPSTILDPAAFLRHADVLARSVPGSPKGLTAQQTKAGVYRLTRAAECVDEVMKFIHTTSDELHDSAFITKESKRYWSIDPRRFHRLRLQAVANTYRKIAATFKATDEA